MRKLIISTYLIIGSLIGLYGGLTVIADYLVQPANVQAETAINTPSFDDVILTNGLQGEEHPYQLQPAMEVK